MARERKRLVEMRFRRVDVPVRERAGCRARPARAPDDPAAHRCVEAVVLAIVEERRRRRAHAIGVPGDARGGKLDDVRELVLAPGNGLQQPLPGCDVPGREGAQRGIEAERGKAHELLVGRTGGLEPGEHDDMPRRLADLVGQRQVAGRHGAPERRHGVTARPVPAGAAHLEACDLGRQRPPQLRAQELAQQAVVAKHHLAVAVARDQEVVALEAPEVRPAAVRLPVSASASSAVRTSGTDVRSRNLCRVGWLPLEDLTEQVVGHGPVVAGETPHEARRVVRAARVTVPRAARRRPSPPSALAASRSPRRSARSPPRRAARGLLVREREVGGADLRERAREPEAVQAEPRICSRREHDVQLRRRPVDQRLHRASGRCGSRVPGSRRARARPACPCASRGRRSGGPARRRA